MLDGTSTFEPEAKPDIIIQETEVKDATEQDEKTKKEEVNDDSEEEKVKKEEKSSVQKRIDFLVWEKKQAQQERDRLLSIIEKQQAPTKPAPEPEKEPTEFANLEEYTDHLVEKKIAAKMKDLDVKMAQRDQAIELQDKVLSFKEKTESFIKTTPDFYEKINDPSLPTSETIMMSIVESEKGPELAYWLAENPAELNRIVKLSPYGQAMALGKIEAKFADKPPVKTSNAPDPLNTLKGGGKGVGDAPSDKDSIDVWMKKERARVAKIKGK